MQHATEENVEVEWKEKKKWQKDRAVLKRKNASQQGHIEISKTTTDGHPTDTRTFF